MWCPAPAAAVWLALFVNAAWASSVTPIAKVVELLHGMLEKAKSSKHDEVLQWTAYERWCSDSEFDKQNLVKSADLTIEALQAEIEKHDLEVQRLGELVVGHQANIVTFKSDMHTSTESRSTESQAHNIIHTDYSESIHAITEAIKVLKEQAHNQPQAMALVQHIRQRLGALLQARQAVDAFLAQASERADVALIAASEEPGVAHGYQFQSSGIIDMLQDLIVQFQTNLRDLEKEEMERRHAHESYVQDLHAQIAAAEHETEKNTKHQAEHNQTSADASARLAGISASRADDQQFLDDLKTTCNQKQVDFEARQQLRQEEVDALQKAIEILSSEKVAGAAQKHLPTLLQRARKAASFLQLEHSNGDKPTDARGRAAVEDRAAIAVAYLQKAGARIHSQVLTLLAARARDEPTDVFAKVRQLITELLARLQAEAANEEQHKTWCDQELGTNNQTRTAKTMEVENLHNQIEQTTSKVAMLNREMAELTQAVATLTLEMAEALRLREEERDRNQATIADAEGAQLSVGDAIRVLQNYYGKAAGATALVQRHKQAPTPPIFNAPFKGQQTDSLNIIAFLQVIQSDFARLEQKTSDDERTAQSEYDRISGDALADKQAKEGDITSKTSELVIQKAALQTAGNNLDLEQAGLDAALAYYDQLKPSCVGAENADASFEVRNERREEEVQSLKEALAILNGQTLVAGPDSVYSSVDGGNRGWDVGITAQ